MMIQDELARLRQDRSISAADTDVRIEALGAAALWLSTPNSATRPEDVVSTARVFEDYLRNG